MNCTSILNGFQDVASSGSHPSLHATIKSGSFLRASDGLRIQRFYCKTCRKSFSTESLSPFKYQKKRYLNDLAFSLLASGLSQRRLARVLQVNRKTAVRKFVCVGKISLADMSLKKHLPNRKFSEIQFDDMESFEHTKCKPLSITLAVEESSRLILDFRISSMKAKGHLSHIAKKKYGYRADERKKNLADLLENLKTITVKSPQIKSDMNPHYLLPVKRVFPESIHLAFKGKRGCIVGQGELKAVGFDPLFSFNHTAAMMRAHINRLFRRTWNTTKKPICLSYHIAIYVFYHNLKLLNPP